jgi:hypothetical protein
VVEAEISDRARYVKLDFLAEQEAQCPTASSRFRRRTKSGRRS